MKKLSLILKNIVNHIGSFLNSENNELDKTRKYAEEGFKKYKTTLRKLSYE